MPTGGGISPSAMSASATSSLNRTTPKAAIAAFERALSSYDALLQARPDDVELTLSSVVPHWRLAGLDASHARSHLQAALAILEPLAAAGRLNADRRGWIAKIKAQLAALDHPAPTSPPAKPKR